jgi:hypothetical protein
MAGAVIGRLAHLAAAQRHPWGLATADREAAVLALARGYDEQAAAQLAGAAGAYQALGADWEAARALLVLGRAQRRAAELAAAGLSNKQVADQLYLSVTTVHSHLRGVYASRGWLHHLLRAVARPSRQVCGDRRRRAQPQPGLLLADPRHQLLGPRNRRGSLHHLLRAPSLAQLGNSSVIAAEGPSHSLNFYWQSIGSNLWNPQTADGPGPTYA